MRLNRKRPMQLFPIKTPLIHYNDNFLQIILDSISKLGLRLDDGDILIVAGKVVVTSEGRIINLSTIKPGKEAKQVAKVYKLEAAFVEVVLRESEKVYGGVQRALLTLKNNILIANAGVDHINAPTNCVALWPSDAYKTAKEMQKKILTLTGKNVGVIITDSRTTPLRMGTIALALGTSGFDPVIDLRGKRDIYGKTLKVTRLAVADCLACAANVLMGESDRKIPAILVKGAPVKIYRKKDNNISTSISPNRCLFMKNFKAEAYSSRERSVK